MDVFHQLNPIGGRSEELVAKGLQRVFRVELQVLPSSAVLQGPQRVLYLGSGDDVLAGIGLPAEGRCHPAFHDVAFAVEGLSAEDTVPADLPSVGLLARRKIAIGIGRGGQVARRRHHPALQKKLSWYVAVAQAGHVFTLYSGSHAMPAASSKRSLNSGSCPSLAGAGGHVSWLPCGGRPSCPSLLPPGPPPWPVPSVAAARPQGFGLAPVERPAEVPVEEVEDSRGRPPAERGEPVASKLPRGGVMGARYGAAVPASSSGPPVSASAALEEGGGRGGGGSSSGGGGGGLLGPIGPEGTGGGGMAASSSSLGVAARFFLPAPACQRKLLPALETSEEPSSL